MRLYHNPISTCSQKVRMVLHEKGLAYESTIIDLQKGEQFEPDYLKLNPNAVVPTLEDNGNVMVESTLINEYLDDAYPEVSLKPVDPVDRHRMRYFCKKIDDSLHGACGVLTYAIGARPALLRRPRAEVEALIDKIPNSTRREARRSVVDEGVRAPVFRNAMEIHREMFDLAETWLASRAWLTGDAFSLADCALLPYVIRVDHLNLSAEIDGRPQLARWYRAVQQRPAFAEAVTRWAPQPVVAAFRQAGSDVAKEIAEVMS